MNAWEDQAKWCLSEAFREFRQRELLIYGEKSFFHYRDQLHNSALYNQSPPLEPGSDKSAVEDGAIDDDRPRTPVTAGPSNQHLGDTSVRKQFANLGLDDDSPTAGDPATPILLPVKKSIPPPVKKSIPLPVKKSTDVTLKFTGMANKAAFTTTVGNTSAPAATTSVDNTSALAVSSSSTRDRPARLKLGFKGGLGSGNRKITRSATQKKAAEDAQDPPGPST
jgi:hypothetical protein